MSSGRSRSRSRRGGPPAPPAPPQGQAQPVPDQQAIIDAIAQAVAQAVQQQQPANPPAIPFAKTPSKAITDIIDLSTKTGAAIYKENTQSLPTKFSFSSPNIPVLLDELTTRASAAGWGTLFDVTVGPANQQVALNLLTDHGRITYDECKAEGQTYIAEHNRRAQNNYQLFECLRASLDTDSKDKLAAEETKYKNGAAGANANEYDGVLYLHLILTTAAAGSRATAGAIRRQMASLAEYMQETAKDDIPVFNDHVKRLRKRLSGLGETSSDLTEHLFEAYLTVQDTMFRAYIAEQQSKYDDGEDISPDTLLQRTEARYNTYLTRQQWKAKTPEQEEIIALKAQINNLKANTKKNKPANNRRAEQRETDSKPKGKASKVEPKSFKGKWAWKNETPSDPNATKEFNGKTYKYCTLHKWGTHSTLECNALKKQKGEKKSDKSSTANEKSDPVQAAMADVGIQDIEQ